MTIYLDIIFVENILMNYIILFATLVILKVKNKWQQIRLLVSGVIGSAYAIIVYLDILSIYSGITAKVILSIVMVYVAFNPQSIKQLFKQLLIFYLISFIFGGCTFALIYFIRPENVQMRNGVFVGMYPIKVAIIGGAIGFIITQIAFKINKNKLNTKNTIFDIQIYYEDKTINIKALLDSGNMLKDPVSEIPVIIIEKEIMYKIMKGDDAEANYDIQNYISKIRMVPFMSIGKENGMLVGIRLDKIKIQTEDIDVERKDVIAGIYDKKITKDNKYNALIGLNLLETEKELYQSKC